MPTEIENIEQSEVKFDRADKIFLLVVGFIVFLLIFLAFKIFW